MHSVFFLQTKDFKNFINAGFWWINAVRKMQLEDELCSHKNFKILIYVFYINFYFFPHRRRKPPCGASAAYDAMRNFSIPRSEGKFNLMYHIEKFFFLRFQIPVGVRGTTLVPGKSFLANRKGNWFTCFIYSQTRRGLLVS